MNILGIPYIRRFLPFYFDWKNGGSYPDARGRLFQPVKLLEAFKICNIVTMEREEKEAKNGVRQ